MSQFDFQKGEKVFLDYLDERRLNFVNNFDADLQEENKKQTRDFSNDFEITKIITSEEDQLLHSKRLEEIEKKTGKKTLWNS